MALDIHNAPLFHPRPSRVSRPNGPGETGQELVRLVVEAQKIKADEQAIAQAVCEIHAMKAELDAVCQELLGLQQAGSSISRKKIQPVKDLVNMLHTAIHDKTHAVNEAETAMHR
ncbi:hypothetical protein [Hydrogenophaga sp. BPS33]|uniref:hypothetical protein n=1 Tax=Hydrogenophaga sp. BPS33 TaxID=2651974 RepID=UPI00131FE9E8|nr:hypothetical protein [Hydrogenophaga sp. BPS33]QHE87568.1 hypothetical protein F9K07_23065 [Hydrogenophaga sp. BPS33]